MTLRLGVLGTGPWADSIHIPGALAHPDVHVVGVWGRNAQSVRNVAAAHGITAFTDVDALLASVDAISCAVPPDAQGPLALRAAQAGKHLLLEKPLARDSLVAAAIAAEVRHRNLASIVFFMRRFVPAIEAGVMEAARTVWQTAAATLHSSALADTARYANSAWRHVPGAALWDNGPHALALLIPVLGSVTCVMARQTSDRYTHLTMSHARGATSTVSLTLHADPGATAVEYRLRAGRIEHVLPHPVFAKPAAYAAALDALLQQVDMAAPAHPCDVRFGVEVTRVLDAAQRSIALEAPVAP